METKRISSGTYGQYQTCLNALKGFLIFKLNKGDINIKQFDHDLVEGFDNYIHSLGKGLNTVSNKYHKKLKTVLGDAQKRGIIKLNPYGLFKIRFNPTHRQFLSEHDLKKIVEVDLLGNISLEKIRDMFLFSCYTGLRFGDSIDLGVDQIYYEGANGSIYRAQNKTGETISIPLIPEALALIKKYDSDERKITGKVFPKISNQKFNLYLKSIATMANIQKELTHHVARHTCATTLINRGVSMDIVSKYLGHANTKATRIYAKMQDETVKKEILRAFEKK
ncbi:MAG: site-specific integrase [Bacteroidia bacterium]|nr:site-specific integrase [Bacteroidia bacterium]